MEDELRPIAPKVSPPVKEETKEEVNPDEPPVDVSAKDTDVEMKDTPEAPKKEAPKKPAMEVCTIPISTLTTPAEEDLPLNTPEQPQPTIFQVSKDDIQAHTKYTRTFPKKIDITHPSVPVFVDVDHKLNAAGDDLDYKKFSEKGETKITANGHLLGGRKYMFSTFTLPGKGKRLYATATEVIRVLGFRDTFMLYNRGKSLSKMQATDEERKFLTDRGSAVPRNKSRNVNVVPARALFMTFGARIIFCGKRVVDDYWEDEVINQGYTEKDHVFVVDKNWGSFSHRSQGKRKPKVKKSNVLPVAPIPPLEDRLEYLKNASAGHPTQVLPGQGITGGFELASLASVPKYLADGPSGSKHNKVVMSLLENTTGSGPLPIVNSTHKLVTNDEFAGSRSSTGLPYYRSNIHKRVAQEDAEKLKEIEYIHGTVETNTLINQSRLPRHRQWQQYWQVKAGVTLGLTKDNAEEFFKTRDDVLKLEETETRFNEYMNVEEVMTKKRRANPNYLGHGNIAGHKPPYAEKPLPDPSTVPMPMHQMPVNPYAQPGYLR